MITSGAKYKLLIDRCALRPLTSEDDLDVALEVSQELLERLSSLEEEEKDYLKVLGQLIQAYEAVHHNLDDIPEGTPAEMLRWLMEVNDLKQVFLCKLLGVSSGRASEIANGVREMSKNQILTLAEHFHVTPGLFLAKSERKSRSVSKSKKKPPVKLQKKIPAIEYLPFQQDEPVYLLEASNKTLKPGATPAKPKKKKKTTRAEKLEAPNKTVKPGATPAKRKKKTKRVG